jgi:hypothetical protein
VSYFVDVRSDVEVHRRSGGMASGSGEVGQGLPHDAEVLARQLSDILDAEPDQPRTDSVEKPPARRAPPA